MNTEKIIEIAKRNLFVGTIREAGIELPHQPLVNDITDMAIADANMSKRLEDTVLSMIEGPFGSLVLVAVENMPNTDNMVGYLKAISDIKNAGIRLEGQPNEDFCEGFDTGVNAVLQVAAMLAEAAQSGEVGKVLTAKHPVSLN